MPNEYPNCFPVSGPESARAILDATTWPKGGYTKHTLDDAYLKQKLEEAARTAEAFSKDGCEHCGLEQDLWTCQDHDGLPCVLCKSCHDANHKHPLTEDFEPDIDEIVMDYTSFNNALNKDD